MAVALCHFSLGFLVFWLVFSAHSTLLLLFAFSLCRSCLPNWLVSSLGAESAGSLDFLMYSVSPPRMNFWVSHRKPPGPVLDGLSHDILVT